VNRPPCTLVHLYTMTEPSAHQHRSYDEHGPPVQALLQMNTYACVLPIPQKMWSKN
jgi:hypothetical protein